ncbi:hypothetical protein GCM10010913_40940 [Paenibacillus aceti]|uniref:Uncharacterized protein n=1 Tax=Paenibacillus aceti TaxID=1820010 RepID=A0ABQ1W594_9BACL|nr:hypothetical protein GCM10010913_40940 [Paenibacillus aceti]
MTAQIIKGLEAAAAQLDLQQQRAFTAVREGQVEEVKLLLAKAGDELKRASEYSFNQTFNYASLMVLPGILFGLMSDKRRGRKKVNTSAEYSA